jgi:uncharacterized protein
LRETKAGIMDQITLEFQVLVKPAGGMCNLDCAYCYYLEKEHLFKAPSGRDKTESHSDRHPFRGSTSAEDTFPGVKPGKSRFSGFKMDDYILEEYIGQHIKASTGSAISFCWHGGEPLMAGIDFYRKAVELQKKYLPPGKIILNGIQTNGTLVDEEWCRFFALEKFTVGLSMDGPEQFHDIYRRDKRGKSVYKKVLQSFRLLRDHGITPEILCVVHSGNSGHPLEIYRFFRELGVRYLAFLPLVCNDPQRKSGVTPLSVRPEKFGDFMIAVFDEWVANDIGKIKVQLFEEAARTAFNQDHTLCIFKQTCGGVPVVERNGDFYPCDHYVRPAYLAGNILETGLDRLLDGRSQKDFGISKLTTLPKYCLDCEVRQMCNGECPKNRFLKTPDGEEGLNYLCAGYKKFFNHCRPFIKAISIAWKLRTGKAGV